MIQPCIDYGISVWGGSAEKHKTKLQRLQKRAARYVTGNFEPYVSFKTLREDLKWNTIDERKDYFLATQMFKCIHGLAPPRLCNDLEMF